MPEDLLTVIRERKAKIVVIGLGYVGLPVACIFAKAGFQVVGLRRDQEKAAQINQGISPIEGKEPGLAELLEAVVKSGRLRASTDYKECRQAQVVLVTVETPVGAGFKPAPTDRRPAYRALSATMDKPGPEPLAGDAGHRGVHHRAGDIWRR